MLTLSTLHRRLREASSGAAGPHPSRRSCTTPGCSMADTPYHRDDLANDLVEAALRIANKVRIAGVSQTAPYRHFKAGHSELMAAVAADGTEKLHDVLERAALQAASSSRE